MIGIRIPRWAIRPVVLYCFGKITFSPFHGESAPSRSRFLANCQPVMGVEICQQSNQRFKTNGFGGNSRSVGRMGKCRAYGAVGNPVVKLCAGYGQLCCPWAVHGLSIGVIHGGMALIHPVHAVLKKKKKKEGSNLVRLASFFALMILITV